MTYGYIAVSNANTGDLPGQAKFHDVGFRRSAPIPTAAPDRLARRGTRV